MSRGVRLLRETTMLHKEVPEVDDDVEQTDFLCAFGGGTSAARGLHPTQQKRAVLSDRYEHGRALLEVGRGGIWRCRRCIGGIAWSAAPRAAYARPGLWWL